MFQPSGKGLAISTVIPQGGHEEEELGTGPSEPGRLAAVRRRGHDEGQEAIWVEDSEPSASEVTHELEAAQHMVTPMLVWPCQFSGQFNAPSHIPHGMQGMAVEDSHWPSSSTPIAS